MANTIEIIGSWPSGETEYVIGTENPSKLPPVSDADNGDVLTVVNGAWKDAVPTGGGMEVINITAEADMAQGALVIHNMRAAVDELDAADENIVSAYGKLFIVDETAISPEITAPEACVLKQFYVTNPDDPLQMGYTSVAIMPDQYQLNSAGSVVFMGGTLPPIVKLTEGYALTGFGMTFDAADIDSDGNLVISLGGNDS